MTPRALLLPLARFLARQDASPARAPCPVIRVLAAREGAPVVQAVAALAMQLSGSHGAVHVWCATSGVLRAGAEADSAEARLLSAFGPTWQGGAPGDAARVAGAGAGVLLTLGDRKGAIAPDLTLLVTGAAGLGNGRPWPAGPLGFAPEALEERDALIAVGTPVTQTCLATKSGTPAPTVLLADLLPLETGMDWRDMRVLAFAAGPERHAFFAALDRQGAKVVRRVSIDGDRALPGALVQRLARDAAQGRAQLVTTERDATRLPTALRGKVLALPMRLAFSDIAALERVLASAGISRDRSLP